jgi:hypothetical protein
MPNIVCASSAMALFRGGVVLECSFVHVMDQAIGGDDLIAEISIAGIGAQHRVLRDRVFDIGRGTVIALFLGEMLGRPFEADVIGRLRIAQVDPAAVGDREDGAERSCASPRLFGLIQRRIGLRFTNDRARDAEQPAAAIRRARDGLAAHQAAPGPVFCFTANIHGGKPYAAALKAVSARNRLRSSRVFWRLLE